jgi:protease II
LISVKRIGLVNLPAIEPRYRPEETCSDEYHGTTVEDPYQWLEKDDDTEVKAWSNAQNQRTRDLTQIAGSGCD